MNNIATIKQDCPAFRYLDDNLIQQLLDVASTLSATSGDRIIVQGEPVSSVYIVLSGEINCFFRAAGEEGILLSRESSGSVLAAAEVASQINYRYEFVAATDSQLLSIPQAAFLQVLDRKTGMSVDLANDSKIKTLQPLVTQYLTDLFRPELLPGNDCDEAGHGLPEAEGIEQQVLEELLDSVEWVHLNRGDYLFRHQDEADGAYILASGRLSITLGSGEDEVELDQIAQGEIIGEIALVAQENRSASVVAIRDCELIKIPSQSFRSVSLRYPQLMANIYRIISERFIRSRLKVEKHIKKSNLAAFIPGNSPYLYSFLDSLYEQIQRFGHSELLSSRRVNDMLSIPGISCVERNDKAYTGLMHWLNLLETKYDFLLYQADRTWNPWSAKCLAQADEVIVVVDTAESMAFDDLYQRLGETGQSWTLLLLHPENLDRPRNTASLMERCGATRVLHVRKNNPEDIARAARILTGNAYGLVLGGGGARGFAHIGVLRSLQKLGIPVDMIGGTSIGAPIAALVAQGCRAEEIRSSVKQVFKRLIDWTLPLTSMIRASLITRKILQHTGDWDIEDYWIPYFCMSTNLTRASQVVHLRGNSASAIRASLSIPGIMPPVPMNGDLLVDGGVLNNLPIDVMRRLNPGGKIIAIDVVPPTGTRAKQDYGLELSGWQLLFRSINPFARKIVAPSIGTVIMQSFIVGSSIVRQENLARGTADYYQNIHVKKVGLLEFGKVDYAEQLGFESSYKPLKAWYEGF